jgi:hypothetical protein
MATEAAEAVLNEGGGRGSIYVLRKREHVRMREDIYKVGRTSRPVLDRIKDYGSGCEVLLTIPVRDVSIAERRVLDMLRMHLQKQHAVESNDGDTGDDAISTDTGDLNGLLARESFKGDPDNIVQVVSVHIHTYNKS